MIPFGSILHINKHGNSDNDKIRYPCDFLKSVQKILMEVTSTRISSKATISKTSIIDGPCIIEESVVFDDFCKIKGPTYRLYGFYNILKPIFEDKDFILYK